MKNLIEKINKLNLMERFSLDNKKLTLIFIVSAMIIYLDFNFLLKNQAGSAPDSYLDGTNFICRDLLSKISSAMILIRRMWKGELTKIIE